MTSQRTPDRRRQAALVRAQPFTPAAIAADHSSGIREEQPDARLLAHPMRIEKARCQAACEQVHPPLWQVVKLELTTFCKGARCLVAHDNKLALARRRARARRALLAKRLRSEARRPLERLLGARAQLSSLVRADRRCLEPSASHARVRESRRRRGRRRGRGRRRRCRRRRRWRVRGAPLQDGGSRRSTVLVSQQFDVEGKQGRHGGCPGTPLV